MLDNYVPFDPDKPVKKDIPNTISQHEEAAKILQKAEAKLYKLQVHYRELRGEPALGALGPRGTSMRSISSMLEELKIVVSKIKEIEIKIAEHVPSNDLEQMKLLVKDLNLDYNLN